MFILNILDQIISDNNKKRDTKNKNILKNKLKY